MPRRKSRWPALEPGDCRHRLRWQQKQVSGQNSFGEDEVEWRDYLTVYGKVTPTTGHEEQQQGQRWAQADYVIAHPYAAGLREDMRILWTDNDGAEHILDVLDVDDREGLRIAIDVVAKEWVK